MRAEVRGQRAKPAPGLPAEGGERDRLYDAGDQLWLT